MKRVISLAVFAYAAFGASAQENLKVFQHNPTNLKFSHDPKWQIKKTKDDYKVTIPLGEGKGTAQLDIYAVSFMAEPEVWENSQKYFAESLKQSILDRKREEILGVPLLLYKLQETATPERKITLAGLVYAATEFKLLFRLTAPESSYPDAEYVWRQALQSMATVDGKMPQPETPGRATEASAAKKKPFSVPDRPVTALTANAPRPTKVELGDRVGDIKVGASISELRLPKGWTATIDGSKVVLKHADSGLTLSGEGFSTLDSPQMPVALLRAASDSLGQFSVVSKRDESLPKTNRVGGRAARIIRTGTSASGPLVQTLVGIEKGDRYLILTASADKTMVPKQSAALAELMAGASIEPKP